MFLLICKHWKVIFETREGVFHLISKHKEVDIWKTRSRISCSIQTLRGNILKTSRRVSSGIQTYQDNTNELGKRDSAAFLELLPFVRTDQPDHSRRNENFPFIKTLQPDQSNLCTKKMLFQQKLLGKAYVIFKLTGRAMVRPASSDKWKVPLDWLEGPLYQYSRWKTVSSVW